MDLKNWLKSVFNLFYQPLRAWVSNWVALLILTILGSIVLLPIAFVLFTVLEGYGIVANPEGATINVMMVILYTSVAVIGYKIIDWPWESDTES